MYKSNFSFTQLSWISIGLRFIFLLSLPQLSQDFYRFIWDGRILAEGISPYLQTPQQVISQNPNLIHQSRDLVNGMQELNASHYSNYPPVSQWIYWLSAKISPHSIFGAVLVIRILLIVVDLGILFIGKKILNYFNLPVKNIFWFILNPLIILELTGNLHFEGLMLFFFLIALYFILKSKWVTSSFFFGLSVATKLLPLILLPVFFQFFNKKEFKIFNLKKIIDFSIYSTLSILVFALSFLGLVSPNFVTHFLDSISLWFGTFEFNASFYYVFRWIGFQIVGWNTIAIISKCLALLIFIFIIYLSTYKPIKEQQKIVVLLLMAVSFYFAFSTTVHPWYLATPLLLSVFTKYKYMVLWSFLIMLSYAAYQAEIYKENLWLVSLEYLMVFIFFVYEFVERKSSSKT
jgi:hypothetical protein